MNNININNLFSNIKNTKGDKDNPLDIYSLFNTEETNEKNKVDFSIEKLKNVRKDKEKKILDNYKKIFHICLDKINDANKMNQSDIIFNVPVAIFRLPDYNSIECLQYIEKKLRELKIDTLIISNKSIFISWANIFN